MTLATGDGTWSARHWNKGTGTKVDCTHATSVRVVGDRLAVHWNGDLSPAPTQTGRQIRTVSAWGEGCQADLARRKSSSSERAASASKSPSASPPRASAPTRSWTSTSVEAHNLDRLIGAAPRDARLLRPKIHVARRQVDGAATADNPAIEVFDLSICEPEGLRLALDCDLIFSCVDRPWSRAVLNSLAYTDFIPVIDGGIAIDTVPTAPCATQSGGPTSSALAGPAWPATASSTSPKCPSTGKDCSTISLHRRSRPRRNPARTERATLSASVSAGLLAQYTSLSAAPAGIGEPGPLRYSLNTHTLERLEDQTRPHCPVEPTEGAGDQRPTSQPATPAAERQRQLAASPSLKIRLLRESTNWPRHHVKIGPP